MVTHRRLVGVAVLAMLGALGLAPSQPAPASATEAASAVTHDRVVASVPAPWTPQIKDGKVKAIAQSGNNVVVGGTFTKVSPSSGSPVSAAQNIVSFNAINGKLNTSFSPAINGEVTALAAGPTSSSVYVGGSFSSVNGVVGKVFLLDTTSGQIITSFRAPGFNGSVQDVVKAGNRLYVGGLFSSVGNTPHGGLVSLNATTGGLDPFVNVQLKGHHNYNGGSGQAQAGIGAKAVDVSADGKSLVAIGNFTTADNVPRDQIAMLDLSGASAVVRPDWRTTRFEPRCFDWAFDSYMRDVSFAPDGSYFAIVATGGPNAGTLCDTTSRWTTTDKGTDVQPVWVDDAGGDTNFSVAATGTAIYVGGHERWQNNSRGADSAGAGAVPRPGLVGLDPLSGVPLSWNPGRQPRGIGAEALLATPAGLWVGSDTDYIGNMEYWRPRIAFFPLAGGTSYGPGLSKDLPANVYLGSGGAGATNVLYRINAGGPSVGSADDGPDWSGDQTDPSTLRNSGSSSAAYPPGVRRDASLPTGTPSAIFDSERWDSGSKGDGAEMHWSIPVPTGEQVLVRLYFANRYSGTATAGSRVFDVLVDDELKMSDYDIVADAGNQTGTMKQLSVVSDGQVDVELGHELENPLINGIEIIRAGDTPAPKPSVLQRTWYTGGQVDAPFSAAPGGDIDWGRVRGATVIDDELFYMTSDGVFHRRTFDGTTYGNDRTIDPYNDAKWSDVLTGSGQTYRGVQPSLYSQMSGVTGLAYAQGKLFYTMSGSGSLYYRLFSPESGIMSEDTWTVSGFQQPSASGLFFGGNWLYFGDSATGNLSRVAWDRGSVTGTPSVVSGPELDQADWRGRALFVGSGPAPRQNEPPVAVIKQPSCTDLSCDFDGSASSDPDGSVAGYSWDFGDGSTPATGDRVTHEFKTADTFTVTLTVVDNAGARSSATTQVVVGAVPAPAPSFVSSARNTASASAVKLALPPGIQPGDTLLLFVSSNDLDDPAVSTGAGAWSSEAGTAAGPLKVSLFSKVASGTESGKEITVSTARTLKTDLQLVVYRGMSTTTPVESVAQAVDVNTASHKTPVVSSVAAGRLVVSLWADRSSSTTQWTAPEGVTVRSTQYGTGSARVTSQVADSDGSVSAGPYGGLVAQTNAPSARGAMLTVVLTPTG